MQKSYYPLPAINQKYIDSQSYFLLFETSLFDKHNFLSYIFINPVDIIKIKYYRDVEPAFEKIERYSQKHYLAGYFSYELGYYFENFKTPFFQPYPLIHLAVFDKVICFNHLTGETDVNLPGLFSSRKEAQGFSIKDLRLSFRKPAYIEKINRIKGYIRDGDTYQVNFTGKYRFAFSGSKFSLYQDLKKRQNVSYGAFCKFKNEQIISLSPELFLKRDGRSLLSRPMKGTIRRGIDISGDEAMSGELRKSVKNLAENLMIVDLVRNDLGKVSEVGSVRVSSLFRIEKYNSLFQMTSTVSGRLKRGTTYFNIFRNVFPGGSVTGAPKIRTMRIIKGLESGPRNIYCGALGIIFPGEKALFNLPIRTISVINMKGEMGIGSGIVYDSNPLHEFNECLLKAKFLTDKSKEFDLLETILWNGRYVLLTAHLRRVEASAEYFHFHFNRRKVISGLKSLSGKFSEGRCYRIRLLLSREGDIRFEYIKIQEDKRQKNATVVISPHKIDPDNVFLYHKTTNRKLYDSEYKHYSPLGFSDVLFLNNRNEVCEGAVSNIIIRTREGCFTPLASCGLLPGVFRAYLIKRHKVKEKVISLQELLDADKVFICNSVRGLIEVRLRNDSRNNAYTGG
ncbi:MAG: aminodeoxychorismate synthase component I [Candidatus Omnitrophota bacterium]